MYQVNSLYFNTADQAADHIADSLDRVLSAFNEEDGYSRIRSSIRNLILDDITELRPGKSIMCIGHKVTLNKTKEEQA